jgi:hypothetical protein
MHDRFVLEVAFTDVEAVVVSPRQTLQQYLTSYLRLLRPWWQLAGYAPQAIVVVVVVVEVAIQQASTH